MHKLELLEPENQETRMDDANVIISLQTYYPVAYLVRHIGDWTQNEAGSSSTISQNATWSNVGRSYGICDYLFLVGYLP